MRVSKEKAAENRIALLDAASRLFREHGIDGVGVAEVAKAAGLTHGALYAHFASKDDLVAAAFSHGFAGNVASMSAWQHDQHPGFEDYLGGFISLEMRDRLTTGCPLAASASEIGRQSDAVSASFTRAFETLVAFAEASLGEDLPAPSRRRLAIASVAAEIGAIAAARAVAKTDPALSEEVLRAMFDTMTTAHRAERTVSDPSP